MLIGAPRVYANQPLSDGRRMWRACLVSCWRFLSLTSLLLILSSSVAVSAVLLFLSRVLPRELCSSLTTFHTCVRFYRSCYNPGTGARAGLRLLLLLYLQYSNRLLVSLLWCRCCVRRVILV